MFSCGKDAQSHQDKTRLNSPADSCRKVTTTRNKEFSLIDIKSFDLIDTRVMSPLTTTQEGGCYSLSIIVQQQRLQGQFMLLSTNQHTAQSSSSYLAPFSKKQHSLLWMFSLIQAAKAQRWKEGDRERCLDGRTALITRLWTSHDFSWASPIVEATRGAMEPLQSALWMLTRTRHCISDVRAELQLSRLNLLLTGQTVAECQIAESGLISCWIESKTGI